MSSIARVLVIIVVMVWGFNFVVIKWGVEDVDPMMMTVLRFIFTSIPIIFFIKRPKIKMSITALYGICFGAGIWGLVNLSIALGTPAGMASLLLQSSAFFTILTAIIFFNERLSTIKYSGIGVAFIGFAIVLAFRENSVSVVGVLLVLLAAVFWTICNVIIKLHKPENIVSFIVWSSLFVPLPILIFSFVQNYYMNEVVNFADFLQMPSIKGWASILFQSYVTTLFGYGIWTWAIGKHGLVNVAPFSLLVPISGLIFGWLLYGETLSSVSIVGSMLILVGLALLSIPIPKFLNFSREKDKLSQ